MPTVSEPQRRAMYAAANGRSTLGIPASVGREFVGKDGVPRAAGAICITKDGAALFMKRGPACDHPGTWAFPAGGALGGETPSETAVREFQEETGYTPVIADALHHANDGPVEFVTHVTRPVDEPFAPKMNDEHVAYAWAPLDSPPEPLHPGVRKMLNERRAADEAFEEAFDARLKCGTDEAMAMDYAEKVLSALPLLRIRDKTYGFAFDRESVREFDADGRLHVVKANISKAAVNPYLGREIPDFEKLGLDPDKVYKLLRHPDELKKAAKTFNNLPLLSEHVPVSAEDHQPDMVIGALGSDAKYEHPYLTNSMVIWAKDAIDLVESGDQRELSCAYRYIADMTPGEYEGDKFDGIMRSLIGNHTAVIVLGRAGHDVVIGDSADAIEWDAIAKAIQKI